MVAGCAPSVAHVRTWKISDVTLPPQRRDAANLMLEIELRTTPAGVIRVGALPVHRVKVHAGAPVRAWCEHRGFLYTRGDVDILPAGVSDGWRQEEESAALVLHLPPPLLQRAALEPRCQLRDPQIEHIAWALDTERREGYPGGLRYAESMAMALAGRVLSGSSAPLARVAEYIEQHLDQDLSIARLADVAGLSASRLKKLIRHSTGLPVHQYVVRRRVARARMLLQHGSLPASQAALEAGFAHQSHLARWLRRYGEIVF